MVPWASGDPDARRIMRKLRWPTRTWVVFVPLHVVTFAVLYLAVTQILQQGMTEA